MLFKTIPHPTDPTRSLTIAMSAAEEADIVTAQAGIQADIARADAKLKLEDRIAALEQKVK